MRALIVVDIQNDFLRGGALAVPQGEDIILPANRLAGFYDYIVATQDWHPRHHGSFAANHPGKVPGDVIDLAGMPQVLWPVHCVEGTHGAAFPKTLTLPLDAVFRKGTNPDIDSYSGFYDNGHRATTGLGDWLKAHDVTDVHVLGLATDYCVKATALDAVGEGFETKLIEDACRGVNLHPGDVDRAIAEMRRKGVSIIQTADVMGGVGC